MRRPPAAWATPGCSTRVVGGHGVITAERKRRCIYPGIIRISQGDAKECVCEHRTEGNLESVMSEANATRERNFLPFTTVLGERMGTFGERCLYE